MTELAREVLVQSLQIDHAIKECRRHGEDKPWLKATYETDL
jgi:hypothetical protein